ncbi:transcriptional regulatory protein [Klebsiella pneumoniae]|nr:transcriptional regulatory protein [Klebsiella pneumoniae]SXJ99547.1 transcriptional regulatory protein [Klebsiella pneumoniae]
MPMKFKQIQAFITVAREGNMTLAAEKMGITQSGLSRLLLSLEAGNDSNLLIVFYVQIVPDDFVMQLHRF